MRTKFTITREDRLKTLGEDYKEFKPELGDYKKDLFACYVNVTQATPKAIFFVGKRSKPSWHYSFRTIEDLQKKVNESISSIMSWEDRKLVRKEEKKQE